MKKTYTYQFCDNSFFIVIFCIISLFVSQKVYSQQLVFTIVGVKGNIKVDGEKAKVGAKIKDNQTVIIGENSYLNLSTADFRSLEITSVGTYTAKQLLAKVPQKQALNKSYQEFVISELTKANEEGISAKNRFQHMNKSGSVKRGGLAVNYLNFFPTGTQGHLLYGNTLVMMWYVPEVAGKPKLPIEGYSVGIVGIDSTSYFQKNTKENELIIKLSDVKNQGEPSLVCKVTPLDKNGISLDRTDVDGITIGLMTAEEKARISSQLKQFSEGSAASKLMQAKFFEDNKMYLDAIASYNEAIKLSDNAEEYEDIYYKFLLRYIKM